MRIAPYLTTFRTFTSLRYPQTSIHMIREKQKKDEDTLKRRNLFESYILV